MKRNISCPPVPTLHRDEDAMSNSTTDGAEGLPYEQEEDAMNTPSVCSDEFHSLRGDDSQDEPENGDDNISRYPSWKTNSFSEDLDYGFAQAQPFMPAAKVAMVPAHIVACIGMYQGETALIQNQVVQNPGECSIMADHKEAANQSMQDHATLTEHSAIDGPTTVNLKNIPNNITRERLLLLIADFLFDFVYLPMDFKKGFNLGYAFVNFETHQEANRFYDVFQGFTGWGCDSVKVAEVRWAVPLQGLEAHLQRYRNSPVMHEKVPDSHKPVLYSRGARLVFPPATKKLSAPKMR